MHCYLNVREYKENISPVSKILNRSRYHHHFITLKFLLFAQIECEFFLSYQVVIEGYVLIMSD